MRQLEASALSAHGSVMLTDLIRLEKRPDGVAVLVLDARAKPMNVVSPEWIEEMEAAIEAIARDAEVRGAIITSAKPAFMAGADLKHILAWCDTGVSQADAFAYSQRASAMHRRLETCGKPFVAAINGLALGGGYELALACHRRIVSEDPRAVVGLPEVNVGLLPGSGGTQRLARMIGAEPALDLLLSGRALGPRQALAAGLVDEAVPPAALIDRAAASILAGLSAARAWDRPGYTPAAPVVWMERALHPKHAAPHAIAAAVRQGVTVAFDEALKIESQSFAGLMAGPQARNIIRTMFVNKGLAEKGARRPAGFETVKVGTIGVVGAGQMGRGIAQVSACAGVEVRLFDMNAEAAERGKRGIADALAKEAGKGRRTQAEAEAALARISATACYDALGDCDLVIEAVFEDAAIKAAVIERVEAATRPDIVVATNTSTLPITALAQRSQRPARFIGLHFFSPVERMALVEIIRGARTDDETLARAMDFVAQLRKTPIVVNDARGFYTSRVFQTFIHEGMALLQEGVAPERIERGACAAGMPMGPLALLDEVTIELPMKIVREAEAALSAAYRRPVSYPVMRRMLEEFGRAGRAAGGGFYDYDGAEKRLWSGLAMAFPVREQQPSEAEIEQRLLYIQALEAARCLEEGVVTSAADADLGSVLGWGFPSWTGGALSLIDTVGAASFVSTCDALAAAGGERFAVSEWLRARAARRLRFHGGA